MRLTNWLLTWTDQPKAAKSRLEKFWKQACEEFDERAEHITIRDCCTPNTQKAQLVDYTNPRYY